MHDERGRHWEVQTSAYKHVCDCDFIWRLATGTDFRIRVLGRPLVRVRTWSGSMSSHHLQLSRELSRLFGEMLRTVREPELKARIAARLDKELFDLAYGAYKQAPTQACSRQRSDWP